MRDRWLTTSVTASNGWPTTAGCCRKAEPLGAAVLCAEVRPLRTRRGRTSAQKMALQRGFRLRGPSLRKGIPPKTKGPPNGEPFKVELSIQSYSLIEILSIMLCLLTDRNTFDQYGLDRRVAPIRVRS